MNKKLLLLPLILLTMLSFAYALPDYTQDVAGVYVFKNAANEAEALSDRSSNGFDLTNNGSTSWSSAGFSFDGTNDVLWTNSQDEFNLLTKDIVVCAWMKNDAASGGDQRFIQKGTSGNGGWTFGRNSPGFPDFFGGSASQIGARSASAYTDTVSNHQFCIVIDRSNLNNHALYIDGSEVAGYSPARTTNPSSYSNTNPFAIGLGEGNYWAGDAESVYVWTGANIADDYDSTAISDLYSRGSEYNPFAGAGDDEIYPQVLEFDQTSDVEVTTGTYQDIYAATFETVVDSPGFQTWTVSVDSINRVTKVSCRATFDGVDYGSEVNRSFLAGESGVLYLHSDEFNITNSTSHEVKLQCHRGATSGARINVQDGEGVVTLFTSLDGRHINNINEGTTFTLNSTSYQLLGSFDFNTSDYTVGDNNILSIVGDGSMIYQYDADAVISVYAEINGTSSAIFEREGASGTEGVGGGLTLQKNVSANSTYTISFYGKSTSASGSIDAKFILFDTLTHEDEVGLVNIPLNSSLDKSATWTTLDTIYINNSGHTNSDILAKVSISVYDTSGNDCEASFRIQGASSTSVEYTRTLTDEKKITILQHVIPNPGNTNTSVNLQTSNLCDVTNNPEYAGAFLAHMVDELNSTPQFYQVEAYNQWDNTQILDFNVTVSSGTVFSSNSTGQANIYHVNGVDNLTIQSDGYLPTTILNHNTSTNTTAYLYQSRVDFTLTEIFNDSKFIDDFNITLANATKYQTTNGTLTIWADSGNLTFTVDALGYFSQEITYDFPSGAQDSAVLRNFSDSLVSITAVQLQNPNISITSFTGNVDINGSDITYSTTNGTISFFAIQGQTYFWDFTSSGYFPTTYNFTVNQTTQAEEFNMSLAGGVLFNFYDSVDNTLVTGELTLNVENATFSQQYIFTGGSQIVTNLTDGQQFVFYFYGAGYETNTYYLTYANQSTIDLYLIAGSDNITYEVRSESDEILQGVEIVIEKFIDGSYTQISSALTDVTGRAYFALQRGVSHRITFNKEGFDTRIDFNRLDATEFLIILDESAEFDFDLGYRGISIVISPQNSSLLPQTQTFSANITSSIANLEYVYGILTYNGSVLATDNISSNVGGFINLTYDLSSYNDTLVAFEYGYKLINVSEVTLSVRVYKIIDTNNYDGSLRELRDRLTESLTTPEKVALFSIVFVVILIFASIFASGLPAIIGALAIATLAGWVFGINIVLLLFVTGVVAVFAMAFSEGIQ